MSTLSGARRLAVALGVAAIALTLPAGAATAKPGLHITDPVGDANGINGQDVGLPLPSVSTSPASVSGADITAIDLTTNWVGTGRKRAPFGFNVRLRLAAPLQKGVLITVTMVSSRPCGDSSTIQLGYGTEALAICQSQGTSTSSTKIGYSDASADGTTVTWHIDPIFARGTTITNIDATTSVFVVGVFDEAASKGTFTYGR